MKKNVLHLLLAVVALIMSQTVYAGDVELSNAPQCWTVPAVYTPDQEVTFYYDVTDVGFDEGVDLYLWAWQPTEPDQGNGGNSSDFAKLTYLGNNIYCKTMVPTEYFNSGVESMTDAAWPGFWQKLKTKHGEYWSAAFAAPDSRQEWDAISKKADQEYFIYSGKKVKGFTDKWTLNEPLTFIFNPKKFQIKGMSMDDYAKTSGFTSFNLHSGIDNWTYQQNVAAWVAPCAKKTMIHKLSNGYYSISMTSPYDYYSFKYDDNGNVVSNNLESDYEPTNLMWIVVGVVNGVWTDCTPDQEAKAGQAAPYPDPSFSYFPSKFCANDVLTLTRQYNGKLDGDLNCKVIAGNKEITGVMAGNRDKRSISINLLDDVTDKTIGDLKVTITNKAGMEVVKTTIPLVPMSEVK